MGLGQSSQNHFDTLGKLVVVHEPHRDYFYHMANDYQGSIATKSRRNLHLDNQPPCDFFHYGVHATNSHNWGNFRFVAFAFQPRRAKYDLGIMQADRVRYGQVVISHFMKKSNRGSISNYEF